MMMMVAVVLVVIVVVYININEEAVVALARGHAWFQVSVSGSIA